MEDSDSDRIRQTIRIRLPLAGEEYAEARADTTKQALSGLINRLIADDDFRVMFNKDPSESLREAGITLDETMTECLKASPITARVLETAPDVTAGAPALVSAVMVTVIARSAGPRLPA